MKMLKMICLMSVLGFSPSAFALFIDDAGGLLDGTDVGVEDSVLASGTKVNGDAAEIQFIADNTPLSVTDITISKEENVDWYFVEDELGNDLLGYIAFELAEAFGYYIVKNSTTTVVLQNNADFDWGVVNTSLLGLGLGDDMQISHVTGTGSVSVPEPGTLSLLGLGLIGLALARRRQPA